MKRAELEKREEKFDIIVGDLADPVEGGPCYQLYTKSFYQNILKPKLTPNGIFVTQVFHPFFCYCFTQKKDNQNTLFRYEFWSNSFKNNRLDQQEYSLIKRSLHQSTTP